MCRKKYNLTPYLTKKAWVQTKSDMNYKWLYYMLTNMKVDKKLQISNFWRTLFLKKMLYLNHHGKSQSWKKNWSHSLLKCAIKKFTHFLRWGLHVPFFPLYVCFEVLIKGIVHFVCLFFLSLFFSKSRGLQPNS